MNPWQSLDRTLKTTAIEIQDNLIQAVKYNVFSNQNLTVIQDAVSV